MKRASFLAAVLAGIALLGTFIQLSRAGAPPASIENLRAEGPEALARLLQEREALLARQQELEQELLPPVEAPAGDETRGRGSWQLATIDAQLAELETLIDEVGQQYRCASSGLFWYTDLDEARAAAVASGKPILSLRMLGRLTDEYSCANSRFFRSMLYANEEISQQLRENFILHWESVRPVPVITVDFGDGRVLKRTVTGNSAHYLLTSDGQPVDVLPGLYGPQAFSSWLTSAAEAARQCSELAVEERAGFLAQYHARRLESVQRAYEADLGQLGSTSAEVSAEPVPLPGGATGGSTPNAVEAAGVAVTKTAAESILVDEVLPLVRLPADADSLSDETWQQIAALHASTAPLDEASRRLIASENPTAWQASRVAISKMKVESPLVALMRNLESSIALDTVRNEYLLHTQIHQWFIEGNTPADLAALTERVYADLFLTPSSDPWLGLVPSDTYTALEDGGLSVE